MALTFNRAMVYLRGIEAPLAFYSGRLDFEILEEQRGGAKLVYARPVLVRGLASSQDPRLAL